MTNRAMRGQSTLERFLGRLKHGLVTQEILDRLARRGLVYYPYLITAERSSDMGPPPASAYSVRELTPQDSAEIVRITLRPVSQITVSAELSRARCFGIFADGSLCGYTWVSTRMLPVPGSMGTPLYELAPDEAYLYDMFISPEHRGGRMAPLLRAHVLQKLIREGRSHCYSITLRFNRSSRRFKARLGARELELRLYLHLRIVSFKGIDLRIWRRRPHLRTPFARSVAVKKKDARER